MAVKRTRKKISRKRKRSASVKPLSRGKYKTWKWWKRRKRSPSRKKWVTLEHNGPLFAPKYRRLPRSVKLYYDDVAMNLSKPAEEVAGLYAKMLDEKYTRKAVFNKNFFRDWRKEMTKKERATIVDLRKCDFEDIQRYYEEEAEDAKYKKNKEKVKKEKEKLAAKYGFCLVDGKIQKVGNFRMEPPGLFRGRGNHPKTGKLKKRILPEDVTINIDKYAPVPKPLPGHRWQEIIHDNTVIWLARWTDNISKSVKYMSLHPSSKLKGQNDMEKYELARDLKCNLRDIRKEYMKNLNSKDEYERQKAVAVYFIDRLALRPGNEKYSDTADTVGCCSLRVQHITLSPRYRGQRYVVHLDFPGKDCIRFRKSVPIHARVYKCLQEFLKNKTSQNLVFDYLNTTLLNSYLNELMEDLTAKVFRTCHASTELESQLKKLTRKSMSLDEKLLVYNTANRSAAILCNHQRAVPKNYKKSIKKLEKRIKAKTDELKQLEKDFKALKKRPRAERMESKSYSKLPRKIKMLEKQIQKLEVQLTIKIQTKDVALNTSSLNYLDPRISVAWCKKWDVPIKKVYNKTQRERFLWAIETTRTDFKF